MSYDHYYRIDKQRTLKIADFGLARDLYHEDYYRPNDSRKLLPVRWMAPEALVNNICDSKTDVVRIYVYISTENVCYENFLLQDKLALPDLFLKLVFMTVVIWSTIVGGYDPRKCSIWKHVQQRCLQSCQKWKDVTMSGILP